MRVKVFFVIIFIDKDQFIRSCNQFSDITMAFVKLGYFNKMNILVQGETITRAIFETVEKKRKFKIITNDYNFPVARMNFIHTSDVIVTQFDFPPFTRVEKGRIIGVDGQVIEAFCDKHNLKYKVVNNETSKFSVTGFMRSMLRSDLSLNKYSSINRHKNMENIQLNEYDGTCLLVPKNIPLSSYENLSFPFERVVTVLIVVMIISVIVVWKLISRCSRSKFSSSYILFSVYKMVLGGGFDNENLMNRKEKLVIYSFIFGNMIFINLYQSWVISFMISEPAMRSVRSIRELNDSDTKIFQYFKESAIQFRDELIVNKISIAVTDFMFKLPDDFNVGESHLVTCMYAENFVKSKSNFKGRKMIFDKLSDPITTNVLSYPVMKLFPLIKELTFMVTALQESGIKNYWMKKITDGERVESNYVDDDKFALNFNDMEFPFLVLMFGVVVSLFTFSIEIIFQKTKQQRANCIKKLRSKCCTKV